MELVACGAKVESEGNRSRVTLWVPGRHKGILPPGFALAGWEVCYAVSDVTGKEETVLQWQGRGIPPGGILAEEKENESCPTIKVL